MDFVINSKERINVDDRLLQQYPSVIKIGVHNKTDRY